jgi:predicted DNA-binding transcriptional regulator AlpA
MSRGNFGSQNGPHVWGGNTDLNSTMALERRMLGVQELSQYLGLRPQTIYNRVCAGNFPIKHKRFGRLLKWDRRDVDHYLDALPANN